MQEQGVEMLKKAGAKDVTSYDAHYGFGNGIHEMGTARMGRDAKTSVVNGHNQLHAVKNVYVTDGASMTSRSMCQPFTNLHGIYSKSC